MLLVVVLLFTCYKFSSSYSGSTITNLHLDLVLAVVPKTNLHLVLLLVIVQKPNDLVLLLVKVQGRFRY